MRRIKAIKRIAAVFRGRTRKLIALGAVAVLALGAVGWRVFLAPRDGDVPGPSPVLVPARASGEPGASPVGFVAAAEPAPRPNKPVTFAEGCVTAACHAGLWTARVVHGPVAGNQCAPCHQPDAGGHRFPLSRPEEELCVTCHQTGHDVAFGHKATLDRGCLACHDPHASPTAALLAAGSVEKTCARCHPGTEGGVAHAMYRSGQCEVCHQIHGSDTAGLLRGGSVEGHCQLCHADVGESMAAAAHSHGGVEGSCLACHAAHAGEHKKLLAAAPREGCVACHEEVGRAMASAVVSHDAVLKGDQCISCHAPHAADNPMMLRAVHAPVCMGCHDKELRAADGRTIPNMAAAVAGADLVHGPVAAGQCAACHSVHGSLHARLLKQVDPDMLSPGDGFDIRNYALCFACHDQNLASPDARGATQFRDGDRNLHAQHLRSERSHGCSDCHAVHTSRRPRLMADTVAYEGSAWNMPVAFVLEPEGGSCAPGCHEQIGYNRRVPQGRRPDMQGGKQ